MLVRRCAWHRRYHGYAMILGIGSWRGRTIGYTDGICRNCAALEKEHMDGGHGPYMQGTTAGLHQSTFVMLAAGAMTALVALLAVDLVITLR